MHPFHAFLAGAAAEFQHVVPPSLRLTHEILQVLLLFLLNLLLDHIILNFFLSYLLLIFQTLAHHQFDF